MFNVQPITEAEIRSIANRDGSKNPDGSVTLSFYNLELEARIAQFLRGICATVSHQKGTLVRSGQAQSFQIEVVFGDKLTVVTLN